jgi:serine/threonine-protein kinase
VLKARDTVLDRPVVIKELLSRWRDEDAIADQFLQEARIAGQLNHPNVTSIYGIEQQGEDHYIVMEHVPGGTLAERLQAGPLGVDEAVRIGTEVLDALSAAHAQGVVHRDVKPDNVLFDAQDRAKLTDFGIANLTNEAPEKTVSGLESPCSQPGTLAYMSPEQARGEPVDERSDVYSAAALVYECLTGEVPTTVEGLGEFEARQRVGQATPPAMTDVADPLGDVLAKALAPDPGERFETARAFREALEHAQGTGETPRVEDA